jgi:hypothetical protein
MDNIQTYNICINVLCYKLLDLNYVRVVFLELRW